MGVPQIVLWAGLAIGLSFGIVGQLSSFCLMRGLREWWGEGDGRMIRAFALAAATAIVGSQLLDAAGLVTLNASIYMPPTLPVPVIVVGGLLFGYGMVMANGCGARALVLLGRGNLRSLLVLLSLGIAARMTLSGLFAPGRVAAQDATAVALPAPSLPDLMVAVGLPAELSRWFVVAALGSGLAAFAFSGKSLRASLPLAASAVVIGLLVTAGWYATGVLGYDDFDPAPLASLTFIAPIGDTIHYAMLSTGLDASFGIMVVAGVFIGALLAAVATRSVRLEGFASPSSMLRYAGGGALMGIGGVMALGCTIGQGLTGISTLAVGSFLAVAGILAGAALALRGPVAVPLPQT